MHVHLPKPLHGWRAFVGEVGIIVLGVLIALGAEQAVENWQWQQKVAMVRKSLMGELGNDRARWEINMAEAPCSLREIDQIDHWAQEGARSPAPQIPALGSDVPFFWMHSANWSLAAGSQTLDHFPVKDQLAFARLYDGIAHRQAYIAQASDLTERMLSNMPLASDPQARRELRSTLFSLRRKIRELSVEDAYMKQHFNAVGVKADRSDFAADFKIPPCAP